MRCIIRSLYTAVIYEELRSSITDSSITDEYSYLSKYLK